MEPPDLSCLERIGPIEYNLKVGDIDRKVKEREPSCMNSPGNSHTKSIAKS